ncbi:hypothetical protein BOSEA31B_10208 [Hyphomicrobiales bacterium]|nr:hypothetical protein BOSEA31B_10208 [Hyphomicrobiales bacterium]CAH1701887.1 hypothetical protein BOSEA1005_21586 [Hyphomicrobiales bacterium]CAI0346044.1 hypothetical protein BO1005MUT1_470202 [Hyphomicrobiales bacterium]
MSTGARSPSRPQHTLSNRDIDAGLDEFDRNFYRYWTVMSERLFSSAGEPIRRQPLPLDRDL